LEKKKSLLLLTGIELRLFGPPARILLTDLKELPPLISKYNFLKDEKAFLLEFQFEVVAVRQLKKLIGSKE
jgi:hypothetical protein